MKKSAIISECGKYRYRLERTWDPEAPKLGFIMLNPSTADANEDDPTIRRCIGYAKSLSYGGIIVCNLFAYRATNPKDLLSAENPEGPNNFEHVYQMSQDAHIIILGWGNGGLVKKLKRPGYVELLANIYALKENKDGTPTHPLFLKGDLIPELYFF